MLPVKDTGPSSHSFLENLHRSLVLSCESPREKSAIHAPIFMGVQMLKD